MRRKYNYICATLWFLILLPAAVSFSFAETITISNVDGSGFVQGGTATVTGSVESTENAIDGVTYQVRDEESQGTDSSAFLAGTRDLSFASGDGGGLGANSSVYATIVNSDGKIILGGGFTSYNGIARNGIARINSNGTLDTSFEPGTGANGTVYTSTMQSDGKILIGGLFTTYRGTSKNRIARLNTNGSLDISFDPGTGASSSVRKVHIQTDGKIVIVGGFTSYNGTPRNYIARLNSDGSLDTSFDPGTGANATIYTTAVQANGKIVIVGDFTSYNGTPRNYIARLNSDGTLDTSFDPGTGANATIYTTAIQADGKILIAGAFTAYNATARSHITRVNSDGTLDTSFDPGTGFNSSYVWDFIVLDSGKIIVAGEFTTYNDISRNTIARLNSNGSIDASFDPGTGTEGGRIFASFSTPDGKILIGGAFNTYNGIPRNYSARLNTDGSLDTSFNQWTGANATVYTSSIQANGKVIIGGNFTLYNGVARNRVARLNTDGTLDTSFDPGTGANTTVYKSAIQSDGKIIISGYFTTYNGASKNYIARLNTDGSIDTSFDLGTGANNYVLAILIQTDGKILIAGGFTTYRGTTRNGVARLNSDGTLDTSFDPGVGTSAVYTSAFQSDGKILIGGFFTSYSGTTRNRIARLNTNGTLDTSFDTGTGANNNIMALIMQNDGKVLIGGAFTTYNGTTKNRIAQLNSDGSLDTSFDPGTGANGAVWTLFILANNKVFAGGTFTLYNGNAANYLLVLNATSFTLSWDMCTLSNIKSAGKRDTSFVAGTESGIGAGNSVRVVLPQTGGNLLVGGDFATYNGVTMGKIARITANGILDTTFQSSIGANNTVYDIDAQADGKLIIVGTFTAYNSTSISRIARLDSNGLIDTTFNPGTGANSTIYAAAIQADGKIIIVGNFTTYNGVSRVRIARLNTNGSLDTSFTPGTGATTQFIDTVDIQTDGKILIGGAFTSYNGTGRNRIARVNTDGTLDTSFNPGTGASSTVNYLKVQSDGKILAGGAFTTYNGTTRNRIVRINADGTVDATFDPGTGFNATAVGYFVTQTDGKFIVGGSFTTLNGVTVNGIARLNSNGTADSSFVTGTGFNSTVVSMYLLPTGSVVIGGAFTTFKTSNPVGNIAKLSTTGALDTSFNTITGPDNLVYSSTIQGDGKILIAGNFITYNGTSRNYFARLNSNGSLDTSFDTGTGTNSTVFTTALQSDEKILIAGEFTTYNGTSRSKIARINTDGYLDTSFNPGSGANDSIKSILIQSDGKILIGGAFTTYNGTARNRIARLNIDGSLDTTFDPGTGANSSVLTFAMQSEEKILLGGWFTSYNGTTKNYIARLNSDGSLDTSFDPGTGADGAVQTLAIMTDGRIYLGGWFTTYNGTPRSRIARINTNGSLDTSFDPGTGANNHIITATVQSGGKVLIGGQFSAYNDTWINFLARLNTNGSIDTSFDTGIAPNNFVYTTTFQSDGKLIVGGKFTTYNSENTRYLTRVNTKNTADFSCSVPVLALAQGHQSVYLRTTDASGNIFTKLYQWIVDTKKPSGLKIAFDKLGEYLGAGIDSLYSKTKEFTLYFNPSDKYSDISYIKVSENKDFKGAKWREYDGDIKIKLEENKKTKLYIKIKDEEGNVSDVFTQTIYVDTLAPTLTVDELADGLNPILSGTTETGSFVKVWVNSQVYGQDNSVPADGKWEVSKTNLLNNTDITYGNNVISIETEDQAGNKTTTNFEHYIPLPIAEATVTQTAIEEPIQVLAANTADEVPPAQPKTTTKPNYILYGLAALITISVITVATLARRKTTYTNIV